jgi:hypothetical protein
MSAHLETSAHPTPEPRGELRLNLVAQPDGQTLDGGWWPYSRDLILEMADLARNFPKERGRIVRAAYSPRDWDTAPRRVTAGAEIVKLGPAPGEETHEITLETASHEVLTLLVIPPSFTSYQGAEALLAAATPGNRHHGADVLVEVTDQHDADPAQRWPVAEDGIPRQSLTSSST